jgi:hypothetical protein
MVPTLTDQLEAKLRGIDAYYPGTHYACLMDADGRVSRNTSARSLQLSSVHRFTASIPQMLLC